MKTPPHAPEPIASLQARFGQALALVYEMSSAISALPPQQYFDFEDGVRVCITLERYAAGLKIHASLSAFRPEPIRANPDPTKALQMYWSMLTDRPFTPDEDGVVISPRGHPHVWMPAGRLE